MTDDVVVKHGPTVHVTSELLEDAGPMPEPTPAGDQWWKAPWPWRAVRATRRAWRAAADRAAEVWTVMLHGIPDDDDDW